MSKLIIYAAKICPFVDRTLLTLKEKGVEFKEIQIDLHNKPQSFLKLSPTGKVPLIAHKNTLIYESHVILEYLEEVYPNPKLFSDDPIIRAKMRIWMNYCDSQFIPPLYQAIRAQNPEKTKILESLDASLSYIESHAFQENPSFWIGSHFSLVDISYLPFFVRLQVFENLLGCNPIKNKPKINHWFKQMQLRQTYQHFQPPSFYIQAYQAYFKRNKNL